MVKKVLDYIDFKRVNTLLEGFNKSTGFVTAILDLDGNILSQSGWRKICTVFHRVNPETCKSCMISDTQLSKMSKDKAFNIYECLNGLYDVAVPLIIGGEHVANLFTGQFFFEKPSTLFFRNQAKKYDFDEESYLEALYEVPVVTESQVKDIVQFLLNITHLIVDLTRDKIEQENLKILLESSLESPKDIIIISLDKEYKYLYFNNTHRVSMITAYNTEIKVGDCIFDFMTSEEDIINIKKNYDLALTGISHITLEKYGDIEVNYYETRFNPIYNNSGEVFGITVYTENVTDRINMENKLISNEKRYKGLVDNLDAGVVVHAEDTSIIYSNKIASGLLGISQDKLNGKYASDPEFKFIQEGGDEMLLDEYPVNLIKTTKKPIRDLVLGIFHKDKNDTVWVSVNGLPIIDNLGKISEIVVSFKDITEKRNISSRITASEEKYRLLYSSMSQGLALHEIILDDLGNPIDYIYLDINKSYTDLFGVTKEMCIGKRITEVMPLVEMYWIQTFGKVALTGEPFYYENYLETTKRYYATYTYSPKIGQFAVLVTDITDAKLAEKEILKSHELMSFVIEHNQSAVAVHDKDLKYLYVSQSYLDDYNITEKNIIGKHHYDVLPDIPQKWRDVHQKALLGEISSSDMDIYIREDGSKDWTRWECRPWYEPDNSIGGIVVYTEKITDIVEVIENLRESEESLKTAQTIAKIGSWELNLENMTVWGSEEAFKIYDLDRTSEFMSLQSILDMIDRADIDRNNQALDDLIKKNIPYIITFKIKTGKGNEKYINSRATMKFDEQNKPLKVLGVIHDVTDLKEKELKLEYDSYHDFLTGLYNRRFYEETLYELDVVENHPLTIIMADINGLKLINDAFGHSAGDELLKSASNLIAENCRDTDLLARIGGDEFVIVMPNTDEKTAEEIIGKINQKAKLIKTQSIPLSISFGHKAKIHESEDVQDVCRSAEDLMYREKLLEIPSMRSSAIETILNTLYEKDEKSEVHSRSVSRLSEKIAIAIGMNRQDIAEVKTAGLLHDIGKIIIPSSIINKIGKLTQEEYGIIKNHPEIGFRILNSTQDMRDISIIVLNHHERWDGLGYPRGVKSEEIPLKSRIISIADAFDAMTSERTYRRIISKEEALKEILENAGTQFDAELVKVFEEHFEEITAE